MASPIVKVFTTNYTLSTPLPIGTAYYTPQQSDTFNIQLSDNSSISQWSINVQSCSDNVSITDITPIYANGAYTFLMPTKDCAFIIQSVVNGGINSTGQYDSNLVYTFKIGCTTSKSILCYGETYEESTQYGYTKILNDFYRYSTRANDALTNKNLVYWIKATPGRFTWNNTISTYADDQYGTVFNINSVTSQNSPQIVTMKPYGTAIMLSGDTSTTPIIYTTYSANNIQQSASIILEFTEMYTSTSSTQRYIMGRMNSGNTSVSWGFFYEVQTRKYGFEFYSGSVHQIMLGIGPTGLSVHQLGVGMNAYNNTINLYFNGSYLYQASAAATALAATYNLQTSDGNLFFGDCTTASGYADYGRTTYIHDARYYNSIVPSRVFQNIWESTL